MELNEPLGGEAVSVAWSRLGANNRRGQAMRIKLLALAAGAALIAGTGAASAAVVSNDLNLRAGPGTSYPVISTMPAGAQVAVRNCSGNWCQVNFGGEVGWASASYLGGGGSAAVATGYAEPSYAYSGPSYAPRYAYAPGYAYGPSYYSYGYGPYAYESGPGFSVGIGIGPGGRYWR
jgi:uncharacterized protein YraI